MTIREPGWQCPKCGRIWAPRIGACGACNDRMTMPRDEVPVRPTSQVQPPEPRFTCESPDWNFNGDDLSYI